MSRRIVVCQHCHQESPNWGRGLCRACHRRLTRAGELDRYRPTLVRPAPACDQVDRFDWVVVERLLAGMAAKVHPAERDATVRELIRRGMPPTTAGIRCGMSGSTAMRMAEAS